MLQNVVNLSMGLYNKQKRGEAVWNRMAFYVLRGGLCTDGCDCGFKQIYE